MEQYCYFISKFQYLLQTLILSCSSLFMTNLFLFYLFCINNLPYCMFHTMNKSKANVHRWNRVLWSNSTRVDMLCRMIKMYIRLSIKREHSYILLFMKIISWVKYSLCMQSFSFCMHDFVLRVSLCKERNFFVWAQELERYWRMGIHDEYCLLNP